MTQLSDYAFMASCEKQKLRTAQRIWGAEATAPTIRLPHAEALQYLARHSGKPIKHYGDGLFIEYAGCIWTLPAKRYQSEEVS